MSYYVTHENSVLNINNAHLKVSGNVMTDVLKLGAMEFAPPASDVPGTVNFTNVTTGVTTTSNLNVGGTLMLGSVELAMSTNALEQTVNLGNTTSNTVQFTNPTTGLVATGNVEVGGELNVNGNVEVGTANLFVDTINSRVGIGTTNPGYKLEVSGAIYASGNVTAYSDRRAKSNIEKIQNPLDKIDKISGYTYTMKVKDKDDDPEKEKRFTGLIAQEVLEILPEAVMGSEDNHYSLAYGNMVGLLVEAIKELSSELKTLKQKIG